MSRKTTQVEEFDAHRVRPLPGQPRKRFAGIRELADSIAEIGQMSPGIVTLVDGDTKFDAQLIDGERRLRACKLAGKPFRAEVRPDANADEIFAQSFAANFGKQDHDAIETALGLDRLHRSGKSHEQLARIAGRSTGWVQQHLNLLKLAPDVQQLMISGGDDDARLTFSIAQCLVPLEAKQQKKLGKLIVNSGMSMAAARRMVLKARDEAGDTTAYTGGVKHPRTIAAIESILRDFSDRVGVYLDMPGQDFAATVDAVDNLTKRQLIKNLESVSETMIDLAESIEERLPKVGRKSA